MLRKLFVEDFIELVDTPQLIVFEDILENNIENMKDVCERNGLILRPHVKTHKTPDLAFLQTFQEQMHPITVSKSSEAMVFLQSGFNDILLAYPLISRDKMKTLVEECQKTQESKEDGESIKLSICCDSVEGVDIAEQVSQEYEFPIELKIKIDVGLHRCGIDIEKYPEKLLLIADRIINSSNPFISFRGILSHAGQSYGCNSKEEVISVVKEEYRIMDLAKRILFDHFSSSSFPNFVVSVGSTPTCLSTEDYYQHQNCTQEIRPGNYIFCDRTPLRLGLIDQNGISMNICAQVVSENDDYYILDCGSKTLTSDRGAQGNDGLMDYGFIYEHEDLKIRKLSEEHGWVEKIKDEDTSNSTLYIGDKVLVFVNHACPVANLSPNLLIFTKEKEFLRYEVKASRMNK